MTKAENAIAWLIQAIGELADEDDNCNASMDERLSKISSYVYAIEILENMK